MPNRVTNNFLYKEFLISNSYPRLAEKMTLTPYERDVIKLGCEGLLQPIRDVFGQLVVKSGKRSPVLNKKVGGDDTSDHLTCNAVDISPSYTTPKKMFNHIKNSGLPYRQIIIYDDQDIIHISWNIPGKEYKREALIKEKGVYRYV